MGDKARPLSGPTGNAVEYYEVPLVVKDHFAGVIVASQTPDDYPVVAWNLDQHSATAQLLARATAQGAPVRMIRRMGPTGYALETTDGAVLLSSGLAAVMRDNNSAQSPSFAQIASDGLRWRTAIAPQVSAARDLANHVQRIQPFTSGDGTHPSACILQTRTPRYDQPIRGGTAAGCGPTAWAILLGWGSQAGWAGTAPASFTQAWQPFGSVVRAPDTMDDYNPSDPAGVVTYKLRDRMSYAELVGQTAVHPNEMGKVWDYVTGISQGLVHTHTVFSWWFNPDPEYNKFVRDSICDMQRPAIVGIGAGSTLHYPVAEAFDPATGEYYLNMGHGGYDDEWQPASTWFYGEVTNTDPEPEIIGGSPIVGVNRVDFNGDGRTDFLSANGMFDEWLAQPDGTLKWATSAPPVGCHDNASACLSTLPNHVVVGDFNGDGRTDFMSADANFDEWLANPDGTFRWITTAPPSWCLGGASGCISQLPGHLVAGDFNGDGRTDFMSANGSFDVWLANPDGTFKWIAAAPPSWCAKATDCLSTVAGNVITGDFDGDGRTDFMSANGSFDVWLSNGDGTFRWTATAAPEWCGSASGCMSSLPGHIIVGDFNGDRRTDFLSANGSFDVWLANADGSFTWAPAAPPSWCAKATDCLSAARAHVFVGDFNGDGRTDFVSANGSFDEFLANPDGSFQWVPAAAPSWCADGATGCLSSQPGHVVVGDFNGDGRTDIVSANGNYDEWLGNPDGSFTWITSSPPSWCAEGATGCLQTLGNHVIVSQ
jgi:hypothetical protein